MIDIKYFLQTTQCCAQAQWLNAMWIIFPIKCFRGEKSRGKVLDRRLLEVGCPQCRHVISPHSFLGTQWQSERWAGWDSVRQCLPTVLWGPWASAQMWGLNTASWSISLLGGCVSFFTQGSLNGRNLLFHFWRLEVWVKVAMAGSFQAVRETVPVSGTCWSLVCRCIILISSFTFTWHLLVLGFVTGPNVPF